MEVLNILAERSFLVNNLYQLDDGSWRANLRKDGLYWGFATGRTIQDALYAAIDNGEPKPAYKPPKRKPSKPLDLNFSLEDLDL